MSAARVSQESTAGAGGAPVPARVSRSARVEGVVQLVIMLAIGAAAGAGSFTHVHDVAAAHGQAGWLAWADAIVLELMSIASGLELRRRKRLHARVGFPAAVMVASVALSLSAQVVQAQPSVIGWIAAAIPALGFLVMVKIALAQARSSPVPAGVDVGVVGPPESQPVLVQEPALEDLTPLGVTVAAADVQMITEDQHVSAGEGQSANAEGQVAKTKESLVPGDDEVVVALIPVARAVAAVLERERRRLSRQALAAGLRQGGHPVSNARVSALLEILRSEPVVVQNPGGVEGAGLAVARRQGHTVRRNQGQPLARQRESSMRRA